MRSWVVLFIVVFVIWLGLSWPIDIQHILAGIIVSALVVYFMGDMFVGRVNILKRPSRYLWFLYYIPVFLWEWLKANIGVSYKVIHPFVPIKPGIVKVRTKLKKDISLTLLANSITLTGETLSVDIDKENGFIYVHWMDVASPDTDKATKTIVRKFEKILERIFE
ncbi:MAG: Na+/H+ antiporter subunit E [Candidatus Omnitrophica bacterium]|nr:Na+/H+ antiporter subunit E [Candidatus Omnitrophota bacterium]MDD5352500.1 Na+/H+ antiporter subunit E [Candidatus Omnitrophota bacterium]MDD5550098.1 Na+/H+ antiporter subunit E [Candidatus Omnitrophota bacterium]